MLSEGSKGGVKEGGVLEIIPNIVEYILGNLQPTYLHPSFEARERWYLCRLLHYGPLVIGFRVKGLEVHGDSPKL